MTMLPSRLRDARILLVDDQELNLRLISQVLQNAGLHNITTTQDPFAVAALAALHTPDLIVVDLHMPGLDGFGVMEALRPRIEAAGYLPILVLTADVTEESRRRALDAGARDFLTKPINNQEVVLRTKNLLETRQLYLDLQQKNEMLDEQNATLEQRVQERTREVEEAQLETLERLARTAEYRDDQTGRHVLRVGRVAALLGRTMGMPEPDVKTLRLAAPLHDLGKIGIPDAILLAPRRLTPDEFEEMKEHTEIGSRILAGSSSDLLQLAERIAKTHHERWDGRGYFGMVASDIPVQSRIVAVADVFDALTHERPYKSAWPLDLAVDEITKNRGSQFDPAVVDAFRICDAEELVNPAESVPTAFGRDRSGFDRLAGLRLGSRLGREPVGIPGLEADKPGTRIA
ncbi:MAG: HD domain-containing phosphohydrolase [Candidatus Limnocylindrales bacterium]